MKGVIWVIIEIPKRKAIQRRRREAAGVELIQEQRAVGRQCAAEQGQIQEDSNQLLEFAGELRLQPPLFGLLEG